MQYTYLVDIQKIRLSKNEKMLSSQHPEIITWAFIHLDLVLRAYIHYVLCTKISKKKNCFFKLMIFIFLVNKCSSNTLSIFKIPHLPQNILFFFYSSSEDMLTERKKERNINWLRYIRGLTRQNPKSRYVPDRESNRQPFVHRAVLNQLSHSGRTPQCSLQLVWANEDPGQAPHRIWLWRTLHFFLPALALFSWAWLVKRTRANCSADWRSLLLSKHRTDLKRKKKI